MCKGRGKERWVQNLGNRFSKGETQIPINTRENAQPYALFSLGLKLKRDLLSRVLGRKVCTTVDGFLSSSLMTFFF